ncbi:MAG TPA: polyamine aminopropyltransferase [Bacteroidia bacterium]
MQLLLLFSVFIIATCGLIYELVAGTLASYLLGDSVTQFSTIIGLYLFSMGIGSYLSKFFNRNLLAWFIQIELLVGVVGGISSACLFMIFNHVEMFRPVLYAFVAITGILVGVEIPLIMRILKDKIQFTDLVSKVFTFDYIGALLASLIFPLVLVPQLGLVKTSFFFGMLNVVVGIIICYKLADEHPWSAYLKTSGFISLFLLLLGFVFSERLTTMAEHNTFGERIIIAKSSPYQRIIVTKTNDRVKLYLNGNLQFNSKDEYRYHESLVHPAMSMLNERKNVLILGGGDGMAVRELLKYKEIANITLVDLDPEMVKLFSKNPLLTKLNKNAFATSKLKVIHTDAFQWVKTNQKKYDFICIDFPDPGNYSVGKLYTKSFYSEVSKCLSDSGIMVVQSTSPFVALKSYWCINKTIRSVGFNTLPYHIYLPSFGDWGYIMASKNKQLNFKHEFPIDLKFLNRETFEQATVFPKDMQEVETLVNKLDNQVLVDYFETEWNKLL